MLNIILFLLLWIIYYLLKGFILKKVIGVKIGFFITISILFLSLVNISMKFHPVTMIILLTYLFISFTDYTLTFFNIKVPVLPVYSFISVKNREVSIRYQIFRPLFILVADLILLFKRAPLIGFNDCIEVDVDTKDNVAVNIKL